jgi:hypothetical protein
LRPNRFQAATQALALVAAYDYDPHIGRGMWRAHIRDTATSVPSALSIAST